MIVTYVTGNMMKLEETRSILKNFPFELLPRSMELPEYQGNPRYVVTEKCRAAARKVGSPVMVEDTCLGFTALKGLPGPYIKYFLEALKPDGLYRMLEGWSDKSATATCTFALCSGNPDHVLLFEGKCEGTIVTPKSSSDTSWDPCFQPKGYSETFAEMDKHLKNSISHRFKALEAMEQHFSHERNVEEFIKAGRLH